MAHTRKQEISAAKTDVQLMRSLLHTFGESRSSLGGDVSGLQAQLKSARAKAEAAEHEVQQRQDELMKVRGGHFFKCLEKKK